MAKPAHPLTTIPDDGSPLPAHLVAVAAPEAPQTSATIPMEPLHVTNAASLSGETASAKKSRWREVAGKVAGSARHVGLLLALSVTIFLFLWQGNQHYPIKHWLFWMYARIWGYCALFALSAASSGHLAINVLGGKRLPLFERTTLSLAAGTLIFFLVLFVCGLFGIYNRVFAIVMPILLGAPGMWSLIRHSRRVVHHLRGARKRTTWRPSVLFWIVAAFGVGGIGLIYFAILSPRNMAYDSYFYHLGIAQQYAVEGGIKPAVEAWLPAAIPHLASVLYAWAFILPGFSLTERVLCAAHIEFIIFLFTLISVPALVRRLVPKAPAGLSWAAFFLFPGIFVYDSSLSIAADHINAFWAIPIYLMTLRTLESLNVKRSGGAFAARNATLLAMFFAAAILTKYQAMYLLAYPTLAVAGASLWNLSGVIIRRRELIGRMFRTISVIAATSIMVGLVFTMPHWLKNLVWYGDPFFPYLSPYMLSSKWIPDTAAVFQGWDGAQHTGWRPQGTLPHKLLETAQATAVFAFKPHDWSKFHGQVPIFGALFSLGVLVLPFLRKTQRNWELVIATHLGIAVWYWTLHQDRYLQVLLPWMVASVAATLISLWRLHWTAKTLTVALVGFQVIWGGDAYFIPAHAMTGNSSAPITAELLAAGMKGKYADRFAFGDRLFEVGRDPALPQDAHVLVHEHELRFGLWRTVVSDRPGLAYAFRYDKLKDEVELHNRLLKLGITHIATRQKSNNVESLGGEIQFFAYVKLYAKHIKTFSDWSVYSLPTAPPTKKNNGLVAYFGCGKQYARGLHQLSNLSVRERQVVQKPPMVAAITPVPLPPDQFAAFIARADFVVTDTNCKPAAPAEATMGFVQIGTHGESETLWARNR